METGAPYEAAVAALSELQYDVLFLRMIDSPDLREDCGTYDTDLRFIPFEIPGVMS